MKETSGKLILIFAAVSAVICGVVRFFQIESLTDFENGFFLRGSETGGLLIYILLAVFAVILVVLAFLGKNKGEAAYFVSSDGMGDNATRILGLGDIVGAFLIAAHILDGSQMIMLLFNVAAAVILLISGYTLIMRIVPPTFTGHIRLVAAAYLFFRTAEVFNADLVVINHAENLIVLISYVLFTAFMAGEARFLSRIETKNTRVGEIILAFLTFLASATHVISDLIALAAGGNAAEFVSVDLGVAAAAVISLAFVITVFCTKKKKDIIPITEE